MTMNAWFCVLDNDAGDDGIPAEVLVTEANDKVEFVVRDRSDGLLARFWLDSDQALGLQKLLQHQFGSAE
jgi:hypothetical protein